MQPISQCFYCKNMLGMEYNVVTKKTIYKCKAFDEIPKEYLEGKPHVESDGKDKGIVFEPNVDKKGVLTHVNIQTLIIKIN